MNPEEKSLLRNAKLLPPSSHNSFYHKQYNVLIGFGANIPGAWGHPATAIYRAITEFGKLSIRPMIISRLYISPPLGLVRQPTYYNAVASLSVQCRPKFLLQRAKAIERQAGRRRGVRWGPRPLDIDIIDFRGRVRAPDSQRRHPGSLVLPHPEAAARGFVLMPICDVQPSWRHPARGWTVKAYLAHHPELMRGIKTIPWPDATTQQNASQDDWRGTPFTR